MSLFTGEVFRLLFLDLRYLMFLLFWLFWASRGRCEQKRGCCYQIFVCKGNRKVETIFFINQLWGCDWKSISRFARMCHWILWDLMRDNNCPRFLGFLWRLYIVPRCSSKLLKIYISFMPLLMIFLSIAVGHCLPWKQVMFPLETERNSERSNL